MTKKPLSPDQTIALAAQRQIARDTGTRPVDPGNVESDRPDRTSRSAFHLKNALAGAALKAEEGDWFMVQVFLDNAQRHVNILTGLQN